MNNQLREATYDDITNERERQHQQWNRSHNWGFGDCSSSLVAPTVKAAVLMEEAGEVARAVLEQNDDNLREELIQVAAVAVAWIEAIDFKLPDREAKRQARLDLNETLAAYEEVGDIPTSNADFDDAPINALGEGEDG